MRFTFNNLRARAQFDLVVAITAFAPRTFINNRVIAYLTQTSQKIITDYKKQSLLH